MAVYQKRLLIQISNQLALGRVVDLALRTRLF